MNGSEETLQVEAQQELAKMFDRLTRDLPLFLFAQPGINDVFSDAARQVIRLFRQVTDKIVLREFSLDHEQAKKWNIEHSPTLLFDPDNYNIRWFGAPLGEEARIFLEALLLIGLRESGLSDQSIEMMQRMDGKRDIKVFVSASCPYCHQQALNTLKAAVEKPDLVSLDIIDIQANPDLASRYSAQSVPQVYANDVLIAQGAQAEELLTTSWVLIHDPTTSPAVKADLIKSTVKWAGLEPKNDAQAVDVGGGVKITINLGGQEHEVRPTQPAIENAEYTEVEE